MVHGKLFGAYTLLRFFHTGSSTGMHLTTWCHTTPEFDEKASTCGAIPCRGGSGVKFVKEPLASRHANLPNMLNNALRTWRQTYSMVI